MLSMGTRDKMEQKQQVFLIVWQVGNSSERGQLEFAIFGDFT